MKLKEGNKIVCVATTEHVDEEESALGTTEAETTLTEEELKFAENEQPLSE